MSIEHTAKLLMDECLNQQSLLYQLSSNEKELTKITEYEQELGALNNIIKACLKTTTFYKKKNEPKTKKK